MAYRITSKVYMGGGTLSTHRTLSGAQRQMRRHRDDVRRLNKNGGTSYHDCRIEEFIDGKWSAVQSDADYFDPYGDSH